jgi:hypothetical protein
MAPLEQFTKPGGVGAAGRLRELGELAEIPVLVAGMEGPQGADPAKVATALGQLTTYVGATATFLLGQIQSVFSWLTGHLRDIGNALVKWAKHLKDTALGHLLTNMWQWLKRIYERAKKWEQQIVDVINKLKKIQDQIYQVSIKPLMDFIQRLRRVLLIFRIFHFKFAQRLDADLAGLESRIARVFLDTRRELNRVINYLNLIMDPFGLIRRGLLIKSALQSVGGIIAITQTAQLGSLTPAQQQQQQQVKQQFHAQNISQTAALAAELGEQPWLCQFMDKINEEMVSIGFESL